MKYCYLIIVSILFIISATTFAGRQGNDDYARRNLIGINNDGPLIKELKEKGFEPGSKIFLRNIKRKNDINDKFMPFNSFLEVWIMKDGKYQLFKEYDSLQYPFDDKYEGLGPKLNQGDHRAPEGFYKITKDKLKPWSKYFLALEFDYPNKYDRSHERTGNLLEIHGMSKSDGCYALYGTSDISEVYLLAQMALENGQDSIDFHSFPFQMTEANLNSFKDSKWHSFWSNLKEGYDHFEKNKLPPKVEVLNKRYVIIVDDEDIIEEVKTQIFNSSRSIQKKDQHLPAAEKRDRKKSESY